MIRALISALGLTLGAPAWACDIALVLAVDVSGSVDNEEFRIQMDGLAEGMRDPAVADALLTAEAAITVLQWTGATRQAVSVPWTQVKTEADLEQLATQIEAVNRKWRNYSTAIGEALEFSRAHFSDGPLCERRVIDISGDGSSNEGPPPNDLRAQFDAEGITVNALVIEGAEPDLTVYFRENVIVGPGAFVITANSYDEYPARMRMKLLREISKPIARQVLPVRRNAL